MFTGIIETLGEVRAIHKNLGNLDIDIVSSIGHELKIDQSVAHNGACLTVVKLQNDTYRVTAIAETLDKTALGDLKVGDHVNLERCLSASARFDGHIVQGHVDTTGICTKVLEDHGSWRFYFSHDQSDQFVTVNKGSVTINGVSLTVVESTPTTFSVAIIPYTYEHTSFKTLKAGDRVNLEFDILGKYVAEMLRRRAII